MSKNWFLRLISEKETSVKHFRTHALLPVKPRDSEQYPLPLPAVESLGPQYFLKQSYSFNSIPPTSLKGRPCRGPRGTLLRCWNRTSVALRHSPWDWWVGCERWRAVAASRRAEELSKAQQPQLSSLGSAHSAPLRFANGKASLAPGVRLHGFSCLNSLILEKLRRKRARKLL